jgi:signal transduction histidine kinase
VARWVRVGVVAAMFGLITFNTYRELGAQTPDFEDAAGPLDPVLAATLYLFGINVLYFAAAWIFGNQAWESARRRHELAVQGEQLRRSQAENARQAVTAERVRIARDLHDVVAHHVSVMGVQAAAARRVLDSDPAVARQSLSAVEATARTAIDELNGLLVVLRADGDQPASAPAEQRAPEQRAPEDTHRPTPGVEQLDRLVDETRATGLPVSYEVFGDPRPVPAAVALSAYRVVQEALTNTVKHAGASTADVRVRYLEQSLEVEINDDGRGAHGTTSSGFGLVGMRERVAVHGGQLDVGPRRGGGFQVRARFPLSDRPTAAALR